MMAQGRSEDQCRPEFHHRDRRLDIHFIHARSKHENALPIVVTHGWPGSIVEQLKIIEPLTNPTAHGGTASDAFHVVIHRCRATDSRASRPRPAGGPNGSRALDHADAAPWLQALCRAGWRLGLCRHRSAGVQAPPELLGIHINMPGAIPEEINQAAFAGAPAPSGLSAEERSSYEQLVFFYKHVYYAFWMATRPQTMTGFADSPIGLATFLLDHDARSLELIARSFDGRPKASRRTMSSTMSRCSG